MRSKWKEMRIEEEVEKNEEEVERNEKVERN